MKPKAELAPVENKLTKTASRKGLLSQQEIPPQGEQKRIINISKDLCLFVFCFMPVRIYNKISDDIVVFCSFTHLRVKN